MDYSKELLGFEKLMVHKLLTEEEYEEAGQFLETMNLKKSYDFELIEEKKDSFSYVFATADAEQGYPNMRVDFESYSKTLKDAIDFASYNIPKALKPIMIVDNIREASDNHTGNIFCNVELSFEPVSFKKRVQIDRDTQERKVKKIYRPKASVKERFEDLIGRNDLRVLTTVAAIVIAFIDEVGPQLGGVIINFSGSGTEKETKGDATRRTKLYLHMIKRLDSELKKRQVFVTNPKTQADVVLLTSKLTQQVFDILIQEKIIKSF